MQKVIALTGASGNMGRETLEQLFESDVVGMGGEHGEHRLGDDVHGVLDIGLHEVEENGGDT